MQGQTKDSAPFTVLISVYLQWLNLSSIPSLQSSDLSGLLPENANNVSPLQTLLLNNTGVDDDASPFLASCSNLVSLEVSGTKLTGKESFPIHDAPA